MIWPLIAITLILLIAACLVDFALEVARKEQEARKHWQAQYGHAVRALKDIERKLEKRV